MTRPLGRYVQDPHEKKIYTIDYTNWLEDAEIVSACTYAVSPTTLSPLVVTGNIIQSGSLSILFYVSGGLDDTDYTITVTMTTSLSQIKEDELVFTIRE